MSYFFLLLSSLCNLFFFMPCVTLFYVDINIFQSCTRINLTLGKQLRSTEDRIWYDMAIHQFLKNKIWVHRGYTIYIYIFILFFLYIYKFNIKTMNIIHQRHTLKEMSFYYEKKMRATRTRLGVSIAYV